MKRIIRIALAAVAVLAVSLALVGCSSAPSGFTPEKKKAAVSSPAIAQDGVLRVGVNSSNAPFSAQVSGGIVGLDVDVAAALADQMGLTLEIVDVGTDAEGALDQGTVDIIMNIASTDTAVTCWVSDPYINSSVALFATDKDAKMPKGDSKDVIEAQASSMSAWEVSNQFGDDALTTVSDLKTAFADLSEGKAQYAAADAVIGSYVAHSNNIDAHIVGIMETPTGYCVGVKSDNKDLQTAVSEALKALGENGTISVIEKKWLGTDIDMSKIEVSEGASSDSGEKADAPAEEITTEGGEVGSNAAVFESDGSTESE